MKGKDVEEKLPKREETLVKESLVDLHHRWQLPSSPLSCLTLSSSQQGADPVTEFLCVLANSWLPSKAVLLLVILAHHRALRTLLTQRNLDCNNIDLLRSLCLEPQVVRGCAWSSDYGEGKQRKELRIT